MRRSISNIAAVGLVVSLSAGTGAAAQVAFCPPGSTALSAAGGIMCQCPDGSYASYGVPCADAAVSRWNHNGSTLSLFAAGATREFRFEQPRQGMLDEGVMQGTVLFKGVRSGDRYSGTAHVFSRQCGAIPFQAIGQVADDERTVTLTGHVARIDRSCRPATATREITMRFELLEAAGGAAGEPRPASAAVLARAGSALLKQIEKDICGEAIKSALPTDRSKAIAGALSARCTACFAEGLKAGFTSLERFQLDVLHEHTRSMIDVEAAKPVEAKWRALQEVCEMQIEAAAEVMITDPDRYQSEMRSAATPPPASKERPAEAKKAAGTVSAASDDVVCARCCKNDLPYAAQSQLDRCVSRCTGPTGLTRRRDCRRLFAN